MIETNSGIPVVMLTKCGDGTIAVTLHPRSEHPSPLVLREPTAREYAVLRTAMREADRQVDDEFPQPDPPFFADGPPSVEAQRTVNEYQKALSRWGTDRMDAVRDPDKGPYMLCFLQTVEVLGGVGLTLDDFGPEVYKVSTCQALVETWETPFDGAASPAAASPEAATPTEAPPVESAPASPDTEPS